MNRSKRILQDLRGILEFNISSYLDFSYSNPDDLVFDVLDSLDPVARKNGWVYDVSGSALHSISSYYTFSRDTGTWRDEFGDIPGSEEFEVRFSDHVPRYSHDIWIPISVEETESGENVFRVYDDSWFDLFLAYVRSDIGEVHNEDIEWPISYLKFRQSAPNSLRFEEGL